MMSKELVILIAIVAASICCCNALTKYAYDYPMPTYVGSSQLNTTAAKSRTIIKVVTSVLYSGSWWAVGPGTIVAAQIALDRLRSTYRYWLPNYEIVFEFVDNECMNDKPIISTLQKLRENDNVDNRLPIVILPDCGMFGQRIVAMTMTPLNLFGFSFDTEGPRGLKERSLYKNFYAMGICAEFYLRALSSFIYNTGWRRVSVIGDMDIFNVQLNEILLESFEKRGISLAYYGVVSSEWEGSVAELDEMFKELKANQPRIIHTSTVMMTTFACYLHRYGLHGRGYAITAFAFYTFDDSSEVPPLLASWCTKKMLFEILQELIVFSDMTLTAIEGPTHRDASGLKLNELFDEINSKIDHPEKLTGFEVFLAGDYDRYMFFGLALNETENILRERNMTLSDLSTNRDFFKKNPQENFKIVKEAFFRTKWPGQSGDFLYDRKADWAGSNSPIIFMQTHSEDGRTTTRRLIAYIDANETMFLRPQNLEWRTNDGLPPKDRLVVLNSTLPLISIGASIALKVVASIEIAGFVVMFFFGLKRTAHQDRYLDRLDRVVLVGLAILVGHVYAIPTGLQSQLDNNCLVIALMVCFGFSMVVGGIFAKLRQGLRKQAHSNFTTPIEWAIYQTAFLVAILQTSPFQSYLRPLSLDALPNDISMAYQVWHQECNAVKSIFATGKLAPQILMAIDGITQGCILAVNTYNALTLQSLLKRNPNFSRRLTHLKLLCTCNYQLILIVMAACFVAVLKYEDEQFLMITCSVFMLILAGITAILAVATKFILTQNSGISAGPAGQATQTVIVRTKKRSLKQNVSNASISAMNGSAINLSGSRHQTTEMVTVVASRQSD